jgi:hypothetical protein
VKRLILASVVLLLAGCASSVTLDDGAKASIKSVSISENVIVPTQAHFIGPGSAFGALGAIAGSASDTPQAIKNHLEKNKIDLGRIVREQFEQEARQNSFLGSRLKPGGESRLEIEIRVYGLGQKRGFSNEYVPMLGYNVKLFDGTNRVVLEKYDYVTAFTEGIPTYQLEEYFKSDTAFRTAFTQSARIIARNLLKDVQ